MEISMKNRLSLYEISDEYIISVEKLLDLDIDDDTFNDTLDGLQGEFRENAINIAYVIKNIEATSESIKEVEKNMYERRKCLQRKSDKLREYLIKCMDNVDILHIDDCPDFSIKVRTNPASLLITNENDIPKEYWYTPNPSSVIDKCVLKSKLKDGIKISGAELIYNKSLHIK
jgi:hypothetical protein